MFIEINEDYNFPPIAKSCLLDFLPSMILPAHFILLHLLQVCDSLKGRSYSILLVIVQQVWLYEFFPCSAVVLQ